MTKYRKKVGWLLLLVFGVVYAGQLYVNATEVENPIMTEVEETSSSEQEETITTEQEETTAKAEEMNEAQPQEMTTMESATQEDVDETEKVEETTSEESTETHEKGESTSGESVVVIPGLDDLQHRVEKYEKGLFYYLNQYQYDCKVAYMEQYIDYIELEVAIYQEMYDLGEVTELVLNSCKAQKTAAEAEMKMAQNESAYYGLYLTENKLEYSDFNMKERKEIQTLEYYKEKNPNIDSMVFARYITDYNNAILGIDSKMVLMESLETEVAMAELLVTEGELSQKELKEKRLTLAQAQYEIEQYYVQMNIAYLNLKPYHQ